MIDAQKDRDRLRHALCAALALKDLPRAGWLRIGVPNPESVAAHSWGVAWLVLVLCPDGVDRERALAMAVVHDLAEAKAGDLTPHDPVDAEEKHRREHQGLVDILNGVRDRDRLVALWHEFEQRQTPEARFVRACDKLDMALQAERYRSEHRLDVDEFLDSAAAALDDGTLADLLPRRSR